MKNRTLITLFSLLLYWALYISHEACFNHDVWVRVLHWNDLAQIHQPAYKIKSDFKTYIWKIVYEILEYV